MDRLLHSQWEQLIEMQDVQLELLQRIADAKQVKAKRER
jgi:hypothetical protein